MHLLLRVRVGEHDMTTHTVRPGQEKFVITEFVYPKGSGATTAANGRSMSVVSSLPAIRLSLGGQLFEP